MSESSHPHAGQEPPALARLEEVTAAAGFGMPSDRLTGTVLAMLAATKPGGRLLELGTGTGLATSWLLHGMDATAHLTSIDNDPALQAIAHAALGADPRVHFVTADGADYLHTATAYGERFDLIFADTWPGKYRVLDAALALLAPGALYVVDDMLPQPNWPPGHGEKVAALRQILAARSDLIVAPLDWSTGIIVATKRHAG